MKKALIPTLIAAMVLAFSNLSAPSASAFTLYRFTSHTFYACGIFGPTGPTQAQCRSLYSTTWDENDDNFTIVNGIQNWVVPFTGRYYIDAYGAGGAGLNAGYGARIADTFDLVQGETIKILVGQTGALYYIYGSNAGGGGTFVTRTPFNNESSILLIAGGGGGGESVTVQQSVSLGSITTSGNPGSGNVSSTEAGAGGTAGGGGGTASAQNGGGGGGGFSGNGTSNTIFNNGGGLSYLNGGTGGAKGTNGSAVAGGFGGGGAANGNGAGGGSGGGGGYSGGGGADNIYGGTGGGGGSYVAGLNINRVQTAAGRIFNNNGQVTITALTFPTVSLAVAGNATSVSKGQSVTLTATVNQLAQVAFYADGKRIANCTNRATSAGQVTCDWKPTTQKPVNLTAAIVLGGAPYVTSSVLPVAVTKRTGRR